MCTELAEGLGFAIARARSGVALTQAELAERCGLSQSRLSRIETGNAIRVDELATIAETLSIPVSTLIMEAEGGPARIGIRADRLQRLRVRVSSLSNRLRSIELGEEGEGPLATVVRQEKARAALLEAAFGMYDTAKAVADDAAERLATLKPSLAARAPARPYSDAA